jgi:hypothetical protein
VASAADGTWLAAGSPSEERNRTGKSGIVDRYLVHNKVTIHDDQERPEPHRQLTSPQTAQAAEAEPQPLAVTGFPLAAHRAAILRGARSGAGTAYSAVWETFLTCRRCGSGSRSSCWPTARNTRSSTPRARQLLATIAEAEGHTQRELLSRSMPDTRVFVVTTAGGEPVLSLIKQTSEWMTEVRDPAGELIGRIHTGDTRRTYTLLDRLDRIVARVTGDLALKHFSVTGPRAARSRGSARRGPGLLRRSSRPPTITGWSSPARSLSQPAR